MSQTLLIPPSYNIDISLEYQEIQRFYAGGHDKTEVVGPTDGIILVGISYNFLPLNSQQTINDPENSMTPTAYATYLWKFFKYRKADQQAFNISVDDPETGTAMMQLFKFVDSRLSLSQITWRLYTASGIQLRQWRALS